jgi:hypothetical protein
VLDKCVATCIHVTLLFVFSVLISFSGELNVHLGLHIFYISNPFNNSNRTCK